MIRCKQLYVICVMSWIVAMCANAHVESPSFKYSRHANEAAAQKNAANQHTARDGQENDGASHHHALHEHHHHGHSHDHGHDCQHYHHDHGNEEPIPMHRKKEAPLDVTTLWVQAIGATLLISVAPFLILIFIPISGRTGHEDFLKTLLSFASGGLLGDAFLHLIPHAMSPHEHGQGENDLHEGHHGHSHSHGHHHDNTVGFCVLMGIFAFLIVEKFVRMVKGNHSHGDHGHGHSHSAKPSVTADPATDERTKLTKGSKKSSKETAGGDRTNRQQQGQEASDDSDSTKPCDGGSATQSSDIRVAAYLNLAADFAHNFTDGLAIGASFLAGNTAGIVSTVTILLHEVPHEIGDFAILVQSGMSKRKAMCMQLVTAIGCLSGTIVSLVAGGVGAAYWVLPFTAGGFIYIATVSVIPELLENTRFWQSVKEIIALILGVSMMMLLTEFENA